MSTERPTSFRRAIFLGAAVVLTLVPTADSAAPRSLAAARSPRDERSEAEHVWVHYDYMVKPGPDGHSHEPDPRAIRIVVEAFRLHGIVLHVDPVHHAIPERQVVTMGAGTPVPACSGLDAVSIDSLRAAYFEPPDSHVWHYAVFAHRVTTPDASHAVACSRDPVCGALPDPDANGGAELSGLNFAVTFGAAVEAMTPVGLALQASAFMHELGHNFGLMHGGDVCGNYKPNYMSVMNYSYEVNGIWTAAAAGSANPRACTTDVQCSPPAVSRGACAVPGACHCTDDLLPVFGTNVCFRTDYSNESLPSLNEYSPSTGVGGLDESVGVSGPAADQDIVFYWLPGPSQSVGPSNGRPIDWNGDGSIGTHVMADINNDGVATLLTGFNDWATVHAVLSSTEYQHRVPRRDRPIVSCGSTR